MWMVWKKPYLKCMVNAEMNKRGAPFKLEYGLLICQARALPSLLFPSLNGGERESEIDRYQHVVTISCKRWSEEKQQILPWNHWPEVHGSIYVFYAIDRLTKAGRFWSFGRCSLCFFICSQPLNSERPVCTSNLLNGNRCHQRQW